MGGGRGRGRLTGRQTRQLMGRARLTGRFLVAGGITLLASFGAAGVAAAATTPAPQISPPPQCFVQQDGALPLCTENPDGTWTVTYPTGGGNLDDGKGSNTNQDIGLAVVIVCVVGILAIVYWQWVLPRQRDRRLRGTPPTVTGVPARQATVTAYYPEDHAASTPPPARPPAPPPEAFSPPAATPAPAPVIPPQPPGADGRL